MSNEAASREVTRLLQAAGGPDRAAADRLLTLVYEQLRQAAQLQMADERPDHTLCATALVHEAYLKLIGPRKVPWRGRRHFYAAAAEAMRRILLDHAKARARLKRGGIEGRIPEGSLADLESLSECMGLAYNLGNFLRRLALPQEVQHWTLTTLREKLIKIGVKVVQHTRYVAFQLAEVAVPRALFARILERIQWLGVPPPLAEGG